MSNANSELKDMSKASSQLSTMSRQRTDRRVSAVPMSDISDILGNNMHEDEDAEEGNEGSVRAFAA